MEPQLCQPQINFLSLNTRNGGGEKTRMLSQLLNRCHPVRHWGEFVCPFCCRGLRGWNICDALQHAAGITNSSAANWAKKVKHHVLADPVLRFVLYQFRYSIVQSYQILLYISFIWDSCQLEPSWIKISFDCWWPKQINTHCLSNSNRYRGDNIFFREIVIISPSYREVSQISYICAYILRWLYARMGVRKSPSWLLL
jgi:hypothetical protein